MRAPRPPRENFRRLAFIFPRDCHSLGWTRPRGLVVAPRAARRSTRMRSMRPLLITAIVAAVAILPTQTFAASLQQMASPYTESSADAEPDIAAPVEDPSEDAGLQAAAC